MSSWRQGPVGYPPPDRGKRDAPVGNGLTQFTEAQPPDRHRCGVHERGRSDEVRLFLTEALVLLLRNDRALPEPLAGEVSTWLTGRATADR